MKQRMSVIVLLLLMGLSTWAQAPQKMTYQSVVRDVNNSLATDRSVSARVWILQGGADGAAVYVETQTATTNANGLMTLVIGEGTVVSGSLTAIDWATGPYFLKAEVDPAGGSSYSQVTVQELLSVPYALYAEQSGDGFSGDYNDLTNLPQIPQIPAEVSAFTNDAGYLTSYTEQQVLSISNDTLFLTGGSFVKLPAGFDGDYNSLTNTPNLSAVATSGNYNDLGNLPQIPQIPADISAFTNDAGYLTGYTEQQVLGISNDTVFLTGGSFVKLPAGFDGDYNSLTNIPNLSAVATSGSYNDLGNLPQIPQIPADISAFTNDAGYITSFTEQQVLSISHDTLFLTGGSFVKLPAGFDGDYNSLTNKPNLVMMATSGSYDDLSGTPEIPQVPAEVSAFTNDAGYLTPETVQDAVTIPTNVSAYANDAGYLTPETVQDAVTLPENLSAFTNDAGYIVSGQVPAQVNADWNATEGAAQIVNKPEIPSTANNATLTIQQNETALGTFSADASSDQTLNITVPTATSQLGNNAGYITADSLPTSVSAFANDAGYLTAVQCGDTSLCEMVDLITSLQTQIGEVQTAISQMSVLLDSLEVVKFQCGTSSVFDYDSNLYHTVQIGNQCWLKENMRATHFTDGTEIPTGVSMYSNQMFRYVPNNDASLVPTYGYLYNWVAAMHNAPSSSDNPSGVQGVCPMGWHVPGDAEWAQLKDFLIDQNQYACGSDNVNVAKALASTIGWDASDELCAVGNNPSANNATGFAALPAGYYYNVPAYFGTSTIFWSAEQQNDSFSWSYMLSNGAETVSRINYRKSVALSVRCLRDVLGISAMLPVVTTGSVSDITPTTTTLACEVTSDGGSPVTARGICWSTSQHPTLADNHTSDGTGTGLFTSSITGLSPNTTYYVRAYATNSVGTVYGNIQYFTTSALILPSVTTASVSDITYTTATCGGEVTADGGSPVTARGICWSTSQHPTLADNHTSDGTGTGLFTSSITGLTPTTTYYVRAYATNSVGTVYGEIQQFTTPELVLPSVTTASVSDISYTTATCGGEVTAEGSAPVTERGVCWATSENPTVDSSHIAVGNGIGVFTTTITDLTPNTYYYVRAYATSSVGTAYGACMSFRAKDYTRPTVVTDSVSDIAPTTAVCGGEVTSDGGLPVTARGVCWSDITSTPSLTDAHTTDGSGTGIFTSNLTDLTPNTNYCVRAYATNSVGTRYGNIYMFRTPALSLPTVTTSSVSDISYTTATCGGEVTAEGSAPVSERGVCWATSENPTVDSSHIAVGNGIGVFTTTITDLTPNTYYYVRAYATSSVGTVYGVCMLFRTNSFTRPTVITDSVSDIAPTTAVCGGEVTSDGGLPVTARGVCWSDVTSTPSLTDAHTTDGSGTGIFTSNLTDLTPNTNYCVRAYATNSEGTRYGNIYTFRTPALNLPTVTTSSVSNITYTTVTCGGEVTSEGDAPVTARGVCWCLYGQNPTVDSSHTVDGFGLGSFTSNITGLTPGTQYWVRAYATSSVGTVYGSLRIFTTDELGWPEVTTDTISNITHTTAVCGGEVTSDGGSPVTARGVCWNTLGGPTIADSHTTDGSDTGVFISNLTDLTPNTNYYVRAYATNSVGTRYGNIYTFRTPALSLPTVTTASVSDISYTTVTCGGEVTSEGDAPVTARGVCWCLYGPIPTVDSSHTEDGSGLGSFTSNITGLTHDTQYWVRAYATSSVGTVYGSLRIFTTDELGWPEVNTDTVSNITQNTAICGGEVLVDGGSPVTARGVCWSNTGVPMLADNHTTDGEGTGSFTSNLTDLTPNTTYYVRAYATNIRGTVYGEMRWFKTQALRLPTVVSDTVSEITYTTAICGGNVTDEGDAPVTARGVCWSTSSNPTLADNHTVDGAGAGSFTSSLTDLTSGIYYCVRAYATSSLGTVYGENQWFRTKGFTWATVTTDMVSNITKNSVVCGGEVTDDGGTEVTARGVCWNTIGNPTVTNNHTTDGAGLGAFTSNLTDLTPNTHYYVRAYATNSRGTNYGQTYSFSTLLLSLPTVATDSVTDITETTAVCGGNVTDEGDAPVTARGVCWGTYPNPTLSGSHTTDGAGAGSFTSSITGLTRGTTYYVRAYATSSVGTNYGEQVSFSTPALLPTVTTDNLVHDISYTSARCYGNVTDDGGAEVTARGFCWSTSPNPTLSDSHNISGTGKGPYSGNLTGLAPATLYYVRAYATNSVGTVYGEEISFTSKQLSLPYVTIDPVSDITMNSATIVGDVTTDGGLEVTDRGFCWGTSYDLTVPDSCITVGTGTGVFTGTITGLAPGTLYYVRAYATNSMGTRYSQNTSFTTQASPLIVLTDTVSDITYTTAVCSGEVTADGGDPATARGVCWSTSINPTLADSHTVSGSGMGSFTCTLTDLTPYTYYYVRAYATNSIGTVYGENKTFRTKAITWATVTTDAVSNITTNSVVCGGEVTDDGGSEVTARGVCWGSSWNPSLDDSHTVDGSGLGSFTSNITGLAMGTHYYVRAYATNSRGTTYGACLSFITTLVGPPSVYTNAVGYITATTAQCGGYVYAGNGNLLVVARGVCWNTTGDPTLADSHTVDSPGTGSFTTELTGLNPVTTYYVRAYATNSEGTSYGEVKTFTTLEQSLPSVTTYYYGNVTKTTADAGGYVSSDGYAPVTARGVCWGTSENPTVDSSHTVDGIGTGTFTSNITGLTPNTLYYYRAYATNSVGTSYGESGHFTTLAYSSPTVTTDVVSNITYTTAVCGGNVTDEGDLPVTARGVCWNTYGTPTLDNGHYTEDGTGPGSFTSALNGLYPGITYYVRAYATSAAGTRYGEQQSFTTEGTNVNGQPCLGSLQMYDVDGNAYNTVWIGTQCWMKENLRTTHFADNTPIAYGDGNVSNTTPYRYYPNNNSNLVSTYGYLYNISATRHGGGPNNAVPSGVQGVCPDGWHVPSHGEWWLLINYLTDHNDQYGCVEEGYNPDWNYNNSNFVGKALASTTGWTSYNDYSTCSPSYNPSSNNSTNFTALPAGYRNHTEGTANSHYKDFSWNAKIWSCSPSSGGSCYAFDIGADYPEAWTNGLDNRSGLPVRCVRD